MWADVNGDGLPDLLVAEPDSGQLTLYLQKPDGTLGAAKTFPTLTGVSEMAVSDWDGDGKPKIFLLSSEEHEIGVTRLDKNGRIAFPDHTAHRGQAVDHGGRPFAAQSQADAGGDFGPGHQPVAGDADGGRQDAARRN